MHEWPGVFSSRTMAACIHSLVRARACVCGWMCVFVCDWTASDDCNSCERLISMYAERSPPMHTRQAGSQAGRQAVTLTCVGPHTNECTRIACTHHRTLPPLYTSCTLIFTPPHTSRVDRPQNRASIFPSIHRCTLPLPSLHRCLSITWPQSWTHSLRRCLSCCCWSYRRPCPRQTPPHPPIRWLWPSWRGACCLASPALPP